ncbi:MAG: response regulator [bacterium]
MTKALFIPTVMLIDDESFDQKLYKRVIARTGIVGEVLSFLYADEALVFLQSTDSRPVDVIFLDINMPRMNGFEFLEAATATLGGRLAKIIVVMLTTSLIERDRERANSYAVVRRFINKPLTADHLIEVAQMLARLKMENAAVQPSG